jgi:hypothetical protein
LTAEKGKTMSYLKRAAAWVGLTTFSTAAMRP